MQVLAALSGGVDSAVAAARVLDAGHDVVGVHMALSRSRAEHRSGSRGCCSIEDASDARRAADVLGIPFYVWDLSEEFEETVVADFLAEYAAGRTPNPCVRCNEHIKFSALLDRGLALGFDAVATGHYARNLPGPELHRAVDRLHDFLARSGDQAGREEAAIAEIERKGGACRTWCLGHVSLPGALLPIRPERPARKGLKLLNLERCPVALAMWSGRTAPTPVSRRRRWRWW